ncbi:hypothetical protein CDAR_127301 [Caerostris darwini]|uniref:Uncharacterized protein n=1 Tax=Caerostris darwini TaxID=1538125 RepID=A0AAV4SJQ6_9ARAC|nr:hypothetical protein CDAR_127301 [Caerostris darwini]
MYNVPVDGSTILGGCMSEYATKCPSKRNMELRKEHGWDAFEVPPPTSALERNTPYRNIRSTQPACASSRALNHHRSVRGEACYNRIPLLRAI